MDRASFFIKNKALFGSYPTQEAVNELENEGVIYFIDLTNKEEEEQGKVIPYTTTKTYIRYEIKDRYIPTDWKSFAKFILDTGQKIKELKINPGTGKNEKMYINCRGGHGRSGTLVAGLICYLFSLSPKESLEYTSYCHSKRNIMRDKWRKIGAPQTYTQKRFIYNFFDYLNITHYKNSKYGFYDYLKYSFMTIDNDDLRLFSNIEDAFRSMKTDCDNKNGQILKQLFIDLFEQHPELKENLLGTGLRPLVFHSKVDKKYNLLYAKTLMTLRVKYYTEI